MKRQKLILGLTLFVLGAMGIVSLLTMKITLPPETEAVLKDTYSAEMIKVFPLINPTIMLIAAVIVGTLLHNKMNLRVVLGKSTNTDNVSTAIWGILRYGMIGGIIAGILLGLIGLLFRPCLPEEFVIAGDNLKPTLAARFLYGGITEEILMRFGLMTFVVWIFSKVFRQTNSKVYWFGIVIAALIFAVGHFPVAFSAVEIPSFSLLAYITIANSMGGIVFGWLYWKKGLESAFVAHIFAHATMLSADSIIG